MKKVKKIKLLIIISVFLVSSNSCNKKSEATEVSTTPTISLSDGFSGISLADWIFSHGFSVLINSVMRNPTYSQN